MRAHVQKLPHCAGDLSSYELRRDTAIGHVSCAALPSVTINGGFRDRHHLSVLVQYTLA